MLGIHFFYELPYWAVGRVVDDFGDEINLVHSADPDALTRALYFADSDAEI